MVKTDYIECGNCLDLLKNLPDECIDLTVTSPPYDNIRDYKGYSFDFEGIAAELFRVTKQGGVLVWNVADATIDGDETGTSFRQALFFKEIGFRLNDTMIWDKECFSFPEAIRYPQVFEFMFVFTKGHLKTFNPIKDRDIKNKIPYWHGPQRQKDGSLKKVKKEARIEEKGVKFNVWHIWPAHNKTGHPAVFPIQIAKDHILSWSNEGDIVLDPFMGSGTTAIACVEANRHYIGFEISEEYVSLAKRRIDIETKPNAKMIIEDKETKQMNIFDFGGKEDE